MKFAHLGVEIFIFFGA